MYAYFNSTINIMHMQILCHRHSMRLDHFLVTSPCECLSPLSPPFCSFLFFLLTHFSFLFFFLFGALFTNYFDFFLSVSVAGVICSMYYKPFLVGKWEKGYISRRKKLDSLECWHVWEKVGHT